VDLVDDDKILEGRLAGAATAARLDGCWICEAPGVRQDIDFVLVLSVAGLSLDVHKLGEDVDCHLDTLQQSSFDRREDRPRKQSKSRDRDFLRVNVWRRGSLATHQFLP